jgi:hypothetical protein
VYCDKESQFSPKNAKQIVDWLCRQRYTREFSNLSSLGLERSLVCFPSLVTLFPYGKIELRRFLRKILV